MGPKKSTSAKKGPTTRRGSGRKSSGGNDSNEWEDVPHTSSTGPSVDKDLMLHFARLLSQSQAGAASDNRVVIPKVTKFSGFVTDTGALSILRHIQTTLTASGMADARFLQGHLPAFLSDVALAWAQAQAPFESFADFESRFRAKFLAVSNDDSTMEKILASSQLPMEQTAPFVERMQKLFMVLAQPLSGADEVRYVLRGLRPSLKRALVGCEIRTLQQLLHKAESIESIDEQAQGARSWQPSTADATSTHHRPVPQQFPSTSATPSTLHGSLRSRPADQPLWFPRRHGPAPVRVASAQSQRACYNCGAVGHFARQCDRYAPSGNGQWRRPEMGRPSQSQS